MTAVRVIDTNVAIGLVLKCHTHHERSWEYVVEQDGTVYLSPTAKAEFDDLKSGIETELRQQLSKHQAIVDGKYGHKDTLSRSDLEHIRDRIVDYDDDVAQFLRSYYDDLIQDQFSVDPLQIEYDVGDFISEVGKDPCTDLGGWRQVISMWTKGVDPYPTIKRNLLIYEGDDPDVCIDAHHIATEMRGHTELGSADGHFIDTHDGEPRSRKADILDKTALDDVVDLRP